MNYYNKLLHHTLLSKEETYELIIEYQSSECPLIKQQIEDKLIRHNFKLIYKLACNFYNKFPECSLDEYIQTACLALIRTISRFDTTLNLELSTYAVHWIQSFLQRYYQKHSRVITLPCHIQELNRKIIKFSREFTLKEGRAPSIQEVSFHLNISPEKITNSLSHKYIIPSLDKLVGENQTDTLLDLLPSSVPTPSQQLECSNLIDTLNFLLNTLNEREREVLILRFGLRGDPPISLRAVGDTLGYSRELIRAIEHRAINTLRKCKDVNQLKQFI